MDNVKLRADEVPIRGWLEVVKCATIGFKKHGSGGFLKTTRRENFAAICRHLWKWWLGEDYDSEGFHHLAAVALRCIHEIEKLLLKVEEKQFDKTQTQNTET